MSLDTAGSCKTLSSHINLNNFKKVVGYYVLLVNFILVLCNSWFICVFCAIETLQNQWKIICHIMYCTSSCYFAFYRIVCCIVFYIMIMYRIKQAYLASKVLIRTLAAASLKLNRWSRWNDKLTTVIRMLNNPGSFGWTALCLTQLPTHISWKWMWLNCTISRIVGQEISEWWSHYFASVPGAVICELIWVCLPRFWVFLSPGSC